MSLSELLTLVAVVISLLGLIVSVVNVTFVITWKISHEKDEHNKKD